MVCCDELVICIGNSCTRTDQTALVHNRKPSASVHQCRGVRMPTVTQPVVIGGEQGAHDGMDTPRHLHLQCYLDKLVLHTDD